MEFQLNHHLHISDVNNLNYFEFLWKYERLEKEMKPREAGNGLPNF